MKELTDLELEEKVAEIEGTAVHNCLAGGRSFPSYLQWNLLGPLMVKHGIIFQPCPFYEGRYLANGRDDNGNNIIPKISDSIPARAILRAVIIAHEHNK